MKLCRGTLVLAALVALALVGAASARLTPTAAPSGGGLRSLLQLSSTCTMTGCTTCVRERRFYGGVSHVVNSCRVAAAGYKPNPDRDPQYYRTSVVCDRGYQATIVNNALTECTVCPQGSWCPGGTGSDGTANPAGLAQLGDVTACGTGTTTQTTGATAETACGEFCCFVRVLLFGCFCSGAFGLSSFGLSIF